MTRLERAALDYAIACLARGQRPASLSDLGQWVSGDAYSRAVQDIASAERRRRIDRDGAWVRGAIQWSECLDYARRIVRARLALYLRLVRRVEAWEHGESWASVSFAADVAGIERVWRMSAWDARWLAVALPVPWHPLWLDAPAHQPGVTARMRRPLPGECAECGRGGVEPEWRLCVVCREEMLR